MEKIGILGAGSWGVALGIVLAGNGHAVSLWAARGEKTARLKKDREYKEGLPGIPFPDNLEIAETLMEVCMDKDALVFAVGSPYVRETARKAAPYIKEGTKIINVSKGIEESTLLTLCGILEEELPGMDISVLSGPSHAEEVSRRIPTTVVIGSQIKETAEYLQGLFMNQYFRVYISPDIMGIELGGALKNIIALAAGVIDGLGLGDNTKAALITRGISEMSRLGTAMGGKKETFGGLSGIGDLIVTCTSRHSRNRSAGYFIGQGYSTEEAMKEVKQVVEGVHSAKAARKLAEKYHVDMPIVEQVNLVLFENKPPKEGLYDLLTRERRKEYADVDW